jgi:biopolymer transport protein ExbB/TolQ
MTDKKTKRAIPVEFVYQVFSLLLAVIIVHAVYVSIVRPNADAFQSVEAERMEADPDYIQQRSLYVVVRDFEQEACFILMLWAFAIMGYKGVSAYRERRMLESDLIDEDEDGPITPPDMQALSRRLQSLPAATQRLLLPRSLSAAVHRFAASDTLQSVSAAVRDLCQSEGERLESELSIIRYIAWAIPSIGFIGTVRGISDALAQAHRAVEGDITGVTQSLGVAFNSTFIALVISIIVMFFVHQLQLAQERVVLETEDYCDQRLIRRLRR